MALCFAIPRDRAFPASTTPAALLALLQLFALGQEAQLQQRTLRCRNLSWHSALRFQMAELHSRRCDCRINGPGCSLCEDRSVRDPMHAPMCVWVFSGNHVGRSTSSWVARVSQRWPQKRCLHPQRSEQTFCRKPPSRYHDVRRPLDSTHTLHHGWLGTCVRLCRASTIGSWVP